MTNERTVEQRGLWYEEFEIGVRYLHRPGRTLTEADNVLFTTLTMNTQALHLDAAFSDAHARPFRLLKRANTNHTRPNEHRHHHDCRIG